MNLGGIKVSSADIERVVTPVGGVSDSPEDGLLGVHCLNPLASHQGSDFSGWVKLAAELVLFASQS